MDEFDISDIKNEQGKRDVIGDIQDNGDYKIESKMKRPFEKGLRDDEDPIYDISVSEEDITNYFLNLTMEESDYKLNKVQWKLLESQKLIKKKINRHRQAYELTNIFPELSSIEGKSKAKRYIPNSEARPIKELENVLTSKKFINLPQQESIPPKGHYDYVAPHGISEATIVSFPDSPYLCIFGGINHKTNKSSNKTWIYHLETEKWQCLKFKDDHEGPANTTGTDSLLTGNELEDPEFDGNDNIRIDIQVKDSSSPKRNPLRYFSENLSQRQLRQSHATSQFANLIPKESNIEPGPRSGHTAITIDRGHMIVYGGQCIETNHVYDDMWMLRNDLKDGKFTWHLLAPDGRGPPARTHHTMNIFNDHLYIFGGVGKNHVYFNDIYIYDIKNKTWKARRLQKIAPSPRMMHASSFIGSKLYIFGGKGNGRLNTMDFWCFDTLTSTWELLSIYGTNPFLFQKKQVTLYGHQLLPWDDKLFLFGGKLGSIHLNPFIWMYDSNRQLWQVVSNQWSNVPAPRWRACVCTRTHGFIKPINNSGDVSHTDCYTLPNDRDVKEFQYLIEKKKNALPYSTHLNEPLTVNKMTQFFFFGGESTTRKFDDLWQARLLVSKII